MNADTLLANPNVIRFESFISESNAITIVSSIQSRNDLVVRTAVSRRSVCTAVTNALWLIYLGTTWLSNFN